MAPTLIDPDNAVIRLCVRGVELEGSRDLAEATWWFQVAWSKALTPIEKVCAAHYLARQQQTVND